MKDPDMRGFTLLEVLVAVALLGFGVAAVMEVFSGGLNNVSKIQNAYRAMNHAENVMNEILSDKMLREPGSKFGDLDEDFSYSAVIEPWQEPGDGMQIEGIRNPIYLLRVTVDIYSRKNVRARRYRAVSLKSVSEQPQMAPGNPAAAIRQLFGGAQ